MGKAGKGAQYKFMIVQPNGKWMQEISDLIEQVDVPLVKLWEAVKSLLHCFPHVLKGASI